MSLPEPAPAQNLAISALGIPTAAIVETLAEDDCSSDGSLSDKQVTESNEAAESIEVRPLIS